MPDRQIAYSLGALLDLFCFVGPSFSLFLGAASVSEREFFLCVDLQQEGGSLLDGVDGGKELRTVDRRHLYASWWEWYTMIYCPSHIRVVHYFA